MGFGGKKKFIFIFEYVYMEESVCIGKRMENKMRWNEKKEKNVKWNESKWNEHFSDGLFFACMRLVLWWVVVVAPAEDIRKDF